MSAKSVKSDDYTSSDFLLQLLASHSKNQLPHSQNAIPYRESGHQYKIKSLDNQIFLSHSSIVVRNNFASPQDSNIHIKNFKLFFQSLIDGVYDKQQLLHIWKLFEINIQNSQQCQKCINEFNQKKKNLLLLYQPDQMVKQSSSEVSQVLAKKLQKQKIKVKEPSRTCPKVAQKARYQRSVGKKQRQQKKQKNRMRKQISYVRKVIEHGAKFIQN